MNYDISIDWHQEYQYKMQIMDEDIENEMHKIRVETLIRLSSIFVHPQIPIEEFALTLAYGYFESLPSAEKITDGLDLCKLDYLAVMQEFEAFKEEYLKYNEVVQNF